MLRDGAVYQGGWISTNGGDNYRGHVHPVYDRLVYSDYGQTYLSGNRMVPNLLLPFDKLPHATRTVGLSGNLVVDPLHYHTLYSTVFDQLWRSKDNGTTWNLVSDFGAGLLTSLHIAWRNPNILYLHHHPPNAQDERQLYRSDDGGQNWTNITPDSSLVPQDRWVGYDLALDAKNPQRLWAARVSIYEGRPILDGTQVFESNDGGQTWTNRTTPALDGVYATNLLHQRGSAGGLYLGTRRGVYYTNDSLPDWIPYNRGLPARTQSIQLVPDYRGAQLRNGTSRSVYQADFFDPGQPVAQISVEPAQANCPRDTFRFAHRCAADSSAQYTWHFEQGTPSVSTDPYPSTVFPMAGDFGVTLTVNTVHGSDTQVLPQFIQLQDDCQPDTIPGLALHLPDNLGYAQTKPLRRRFSHLTLSAWVYPDTLLEPRTGLLTHADDSVPAGLLLNDQGELTFCWGRCPWNWRSGLRLTPNVWSHVALVISPDSVQVVLNGVAATYPTNLGALDWYDPLVIGRYADWVARTFQGSIDEVCVWDTTLSLTQLQQKRHLTRYPAQESHLLHYYQFNQTNGPEQDRQGTAHLTLVGSAQKRRSTAPVGGGHAEWRATVAQGTTAFPGTGWQGQLDQPLPNRAVVATRLHVPPDTAPAPTSVYWVTNAYGSVDSLGLDSLWLTLPDGQQFPMGWHRLYQRPANADGNTWGAPLDSLWLGSPQQQLVFGGWTGPLPFGQWTVGSDRAILVPVGQRVDREAVLQAHLYPNPLPQGRPLHLRLPSTEQYQLTLYTADGKAIEQFQVQGPEATLMLPPLQTGWYGVRLATPTWRQGVWLQIVP